MIWLTWRQFRAEAAAVALAVMAFAIALAITGPRLVEVSRLFPDTVLDQFTRTDQLLYNAGLVLLAVAPAVVGAFWGAPMVARELERGTHRLVWNQSITRSRWLATKLGVTLLSGAAAIGVLTLAVTWWSDPLDGSTGATQGSLPARMTPVAFAMRGIVPVAYTVFALVLGVAVGLVLRRSVPAMAVTLAIFVAVQVAVPLWVRPHLVPPQRETITIADHFVGVSFRGADEPIRLVVTTGDRDDWILSSTTVDTAGDQVAPPPWFQDCFPPPDGVPAEVTAVRAKDPESCFARLDAQGYRQLVVSQPASRFWPLQWAETALFLGLAGLLTWFCFWWTRRLT